ncbi:hypothetical protein SAY87_026264 [Trapa incisa]|uniref:cellulase n=1 Tax=Trapa incisa TaxID=236973 RepID=A0AAN7GV43_9MYRT|nr:hypothetical protein SAY87_026264 [Trapa incisa]
MALRLRPHLRTRTRGENVDLVRGYYDVGDNSKFGLPMASNTASKWGTQASLAEAIMSGTDYFIKAHTHPNVLWVQV